MTSHDSIDCAPPERRVTDQNELIHTPSYARVRKGLGNIATGTLMQSELFPDIVSTFGKGKFEPEQLVVSIHEGVRSFMDDNLENSRIGNMILRSRSAQILAVLVPRQEQQDRVIEISDRLLQEDDKDISDHAPPQGPRKKNFSGKKTRKRQPSQWDLSARHATTRRDASNEPKLSKSRPTAPGVKPRQKNRKNRK